MYILFSQHVYRQKRPIMVCRLFGAKPLSKPMIGYWQIGHSEQTSEQFPSKYHIFIHENASDCIVCEVVAVLSRYQCVELKVPSHRTYLLQLTDVTPGMDIRRLNIGLVGVLIIPLVKDLSHIISQIYSSNLKKQMESQRY